MFVDLILFNLSVNLLLTSCVADPSCLVPSLPAGLWVESAGANSVVIRITPPPPAPACHTLAPLAYQYTILYWNITQRASCQEQPWNCTQLVGS